MFRLVFIDSTFKQIISKYMFFYIKNKEKLAQIILKGKFYTYQAASKYSTLYLNILPSLLLALTYYLKSCYFYIRRYKFIRFYDKSC